MLTAVANTQDLVARLSSLPAAVQQAVMVRAAAPAEAKTAAIRRLSQRARDRRLQPDRAEAMARLSRPAGSPGGPDVDADKIRQAAVQAALTALGRG